MNNIEIYKTNTKLIAQNDWYHVILVVISVQRLYRYQSVVASGSVNL